MFSTCERIWLTTIFCYNLFGSLKKNEHLLKVSTIGLLPNLFLQQNKSIKTSYTKHQTNNIYHMHTNLHQTIFYSLVFPFVYFLSGIDPSIIRDRWWWYVCLSITTWTGSTHWEIRSKIKQKLSRKFEKST